MNHPRSDELLQALRLVNSGKFHEELVKIEKKANEERIESLIQDEFLSALKDLLDKSRREPPVKCGHRNAEMIDQTRMKCPDCGLVYED